MCWTEESILLESAAAGACVYPQTKISQHETHVQPNSRKRKVPRCGRMRNWKSNSDHSDVLERQELSFKSAAAAGASIYNKRLKITGLCAARLAVRKTCKLWLNEKQKTKDIDDLDYVLDRGEPSLESATAAGACVYSRKSRHYKVLCAATQQENKTLPKPWM
jgi:hypothetical protein